MIWSKMVKTDYSNFYHLYVTKVITVGFALIGGSYKKHVHNREISTL